MKKFLGKLNFGVLVAAVIYLLLLFLAVLIQIIMRNFFDAGSVKLEEFARYCSVSAVFLLIPVLAWEKGHIVVDMLVSKMPVKAARILTACGDFICTAFMTFLLFSIHGVMENNWNVKTPGMGMLNIVYYITITVGIVLALVVFLWNGIHEVKNEKGKNV